MKLCRVVKLGEETIIVMYGINHFCINDFGSPNKHHTIKKMIRDSQVGQEMSLAELLKSVKDYRVKICSTNTKVPEYIES